MIQDYLGEALRRFLNSLLDRIKKQVLPDYFLPARNLFENIPDRVLAELHRSIFRMTENPVMHLLIAMKNLCFNPGTFPKINFNKLYSIFVVDNPLKLLNPMFRTKNDVYLETDEGADNIDDEVWHLSSAGNAQFDRLERTKQKIKRVKFAVTDKHISAPTERRLSTNSIDVKACVNLFKICFW